MSPVFPTVLLTNGIAYSNSIPAGEARYFIVEVPRSAMLEVLGQPYIRTASAKGVPWPANAPRHSFCSYHLGRHENAGKTALEAGHSPLIEKPEEFQAALADHLRG